MSNLYTLSSALPLPFQRKKNFLWDGDFKKNALKGCLTLFLFFLLGFQTVSAHAVQVGYVILPNGFIRVYIEHWHGALTEAQLQGNGMSITTTYGNTTVTQNVDPTGAFNNVAWNNLPGAGANIIILSKSSSANLYNDWAYYDFAPAACNVPVTITLNGGLTVVLTEAESQIWPQTISGTFNDTSAPTITPVNTTVSVPCGTAGANVNFSATAVDNCTPNVGVTFDISPGTFFNLGTTNVTATASDNNGNIAHLTFPVTVNVTPLPAATISANRPTTFCAGDSVILTASAGNTYKWNTGATTSSITVKTSGSYSVTVTNNNGCSASSAATAVTVNPLPAPAISASGPTSFCIGGSVTLTSSPASTYHWSNGATTKSITVSTADSYSVTVTNTSGCSATSAATAVTVNPLPVATITADGPTTFCPSGSVTLTASPEASYLWSTGDTTRSISVHATGNYSVTVRNPSGCSATSAATAVTVQDTENPAFTSTQANAVVALDAITGTATLGDYVSAATATDNCSISGITQFPLAGTPLVINTPTTVTLTVTDPSGNNTTQRFTVTATDQTAPVVPVLADVTGECSAIAVAPLAIDNFAGSVTGTTTDPLTYTAQGSYVIHWSFDDGNGNVSTTTQNVIVKDVTAPTVVTQNITVQLNASGAASITAAQINNGSTDNCGIATYALDKTAFDCSKTGSNTVTLTVTDIHGNAASAQATVTVLDTIKPKAIAQNLTIQLNAAGTASITPAQINAGSYDNCSIATYALSRSTFDCSNYGANIVTLTVTDPSGNQSAATATVTVQDLIAPTVNTKNITVYLSGGRTTITPAMVDNGSFDACGIKSMTLDKTTFDCSTQGANTVTLTVTDIHGNVSSNTAVVTVVGKTPTPLITVSRTDNTNTGMDGKTITLGYGAQSVILTASNANSPATSTYSWIPATGLSSTTAANPVFTPTQAGSFTFTVIVTSEYGCQASTSVTINVIDVRCAPNKVSICHPTGSASNPYTQLCVSVNAVPAQLAQGGTLGTCTVPVKQPTSLSSAVSSATAPEAVTELPIALKAYPNPFGKRTTVVFSLPTTEQNVTLEVYNSLGNKVATLYKGSVEANVTNSYVFDGSNLAAGMYFVRLLTSGGIQTFRLVMAQ
jgi:hypothetical protein